MSLMRIRWRFDEQVRCFDYYVYRKQNGIKYDRRKKNYGLY